jgi:signal transduction histidine kinase
MKMFQKLNLRLKFIAGLVMSAFVLGVFLFIIIFHHFNSVMQREISQRSKMLLAQANSVQEYVQTDLRPQMYELVDENDFILKAMSSSYISRKVMERLESEGEEKIYYRRVAVNARNPSYEPTEFEQKIISKFRENEDLDFHEEDSVFRGVKYHLVSRPVRFTESCMPCHGSPENAPKALIERYGDKKGFFHTENEIAGAVVAGFPVQMIKDPVKDITLQYLSFYFLWLLIFSCIIGLFFDRLVMTNLKKLGQVFEVRFSGEKEKKIIEKIEKKDEIEGLVEGIDELAAALFDANRKLEIHSITLEEKISERTKELELAAKKHLNDLGLFSKLITRFTDTFDPETVIRDALESIGLRYEAHQVVYYCTVVSEKYYAWHEELSVEKLDSDIKNILWDAAVLFRDNRIYIPVSSHESHWGVLCICFDRKIEKQDFDDAVLLSLGLQLGSSLENIHAVSEMKYQNELLESVFEGITDPLLLTDRELRVIFGNKGSEVLFENHGTTDLKSLVKNSSRVTQNIDFENEPAVTEIETKKGRFFRAFLYPLPRHEKRDLRMVMYARDITTEKKLLEEIRQAERLSSIGKMAAGIAHEINNPLGVIRCYADLLSDSLKEEKNISDLKVIIDQTKKVQKIVLNLLSFSRARDISKGKALLNEGIFQIIEILSFQASARKINLEFFPEADIAPIRCIPSVLDQIVTNIVLNAFDASGDEGGHVTIRTFGLENEALLEISDEGEGINQEVMENIFDPFFTTKEVGKGTGLGLSVVYGFMSELGGRIEAFSDDRTVFRLYFPYSDEKGELNG